MKGYLTASGYVGFTGFKSMIFPTEEEYMEYVRERKEEVEDERREEKRLSGS